LVVMVLNQTTASDAKAGLVGTGEAIEICFPHH
jgi:hypothetical protein